MTDADTMPVSHASLRGIPMEGSGRTKQRSVQRGSTIRALFLTLCPTIYGFLAQNMSPDIIGMLGTFTRDISSLAKLRASSAMRRQVPWSDVYIVIADRSGSVMAMAMTIHTDSMIARLMSW